MAQVPLDIRGFKGLNFRESPGFINDENLVRCENFNIGRTGELTKRTGFSLLHNGTELTGKVNLLGYYRTDSHSQILAVSDAGLFYSSDGGSWTNISAGTGYTFGVQYVDKFYILHQNNLRSWDGVTLGSTIAGSPGGTFATIFKERLFVLGDSANPQRLYFSDIGDPETWPSTNFIDVGAGDGDPLVAAGIIQDILIIFKARTTWSLNVQGAPENWVLRTINTETGCISSRGVREIENFLYFIGSRAIWKTDGFEFDEISKDIDTVFVNRTINNDTINLDSCAEWENMFILLVHPQSTSNVFRYFVYQSDTNGWTEWTTAKSIHPSTFLEVDSPELGKRLFAGSLGENGQVYRFGEEIYTDAGEPYTSIFETKHFDFALPSVMKRGKWCGVDVHSEDTFELQHIIEDDIQPALISTGQMARRIHKINGPGYFRTWGFKITEKSSKPFSFFQLSLWMHRKPTVAKAYT